MDIKLSFYAEALIREIEVRVHIPQGFDSKKDKIIYLFHGYVGNMNDWTRMGNAINASEKHKIALIMPNLENSWAQNIEGGYNYFDFLAYECIDKVLNAFSWTHDNLYIAGLSMGGYAALSVGLQRDIFNAIGTFSGVCDIVQRFSVEVPNNQVNNKKSVKDTDSIEYILNQRDKKYPKLFQYCGSSDHLYKMNLKYKEIFKTHVDDFKYMTDNRGHEWSAWTDCLEWYMNFIEEKNE